MSSTGMSLAQRRWHEVLGFCVAFCAIVGATAQADARPANVSKEADRWLEKHLSVAMPSLLQTEYGPMDTKHVFVVDDLGDWGAARAKGGHQGTDFVLDLPHVADESGRLYVGSILDGKVVHVFPDYGAYGNTVFIHRADSPNLIFVFAHLDTVFVEKDEDVVVGDLLGIFGCSGNCRGLSGKHVRNQVHVEVYDMPDDFAPDKITWSSRPMRQLRSLARHTPRKPHGIDIAKYVGDYELGSISRDALGQRYSKNAKKGGLDKYLAKVAKKAEKEASAKQDEEPAPVEPETSVVTDVPEATPDEPVEEASASSALTAASEPSPAQQPPAAAAEPEPADDGGAQREIEAADAVLERLQALEKGRTASESPPL